MCECVYVCFQINLIKMMNFKLQLYLSCIIMTNETMCLYTYTKQNMILPP